MHFIITVYYHIQICISLSLFIIITKYAFHYHCLLSYPNMHFIISVYYHIQICISLSLFIIISKYAFHYHCLLSYPNMHFTITVYYHILLIPPSCNFWSIILLWNAQDAQFCEMLVSLRIQFLRIPFHRNRSKSQTTKAIEWVPELSTGRMDNSGEYNHFTPPTCLLHWASWLDHVRTNFNTPAAFDTIEYNILQPHCHSLQVFIRVGISWIKWLLAILQLWQINLGSNLHWLPIRLHLFKNCYSPSQGLRLCE